MSSHYCEEIWAHPDKPLKIHLKKVGEIAESLSQSIPLKILDKKIFTDVAHLIGLYHDIGKATPFFQDYLREKDLDKKNRMKNMDETKHSLISAIASYFAVDEYLKEKDEYSFKSFLPVVSFIVVRRHHTNLVSVLEDLKFEKEEVLKKQIDNLYLHCLSFLPYWDVVCKKLKKLPESWKLKKYNLIKWLKENKEIYTPYIIQHLLYSILLDADKHQAAVGEIPGRKSLSSNIIETYRKKREFDKPKTEIDKLRNEIYQKVLNRVDEINLDKHHILSLTAPTGSGKTLSSLAFAFKLRERIFEGKRYIPRIIYCLPFLSIIDQNAEVIKNIFQFTTGKPPQSDQFLIHHHLSDYSYTVENTEYGSDESEILIEGWDSEIVVTTFVQLFHTLFSDKNCAIRKFNKMAGSIIILDEIQNFPHKYWLLFKEMAETMSKYLDSYFILSTATQPAIFENTFEILRENKKYFQGLERTKIMVNIKKPQNITEFTHEAINRIIETEKNTLIVLNTVRAAEAVWDTIKEPLKNKGFETYFLSSHVTPLERLQRIRNIKFSSRKKVVVSTQLVEAGVDIDMEKVIRDMGPFDSINQVAGRANRNFKMKLGDIEIVLLLDEKNNRPFANYIYDPILIDCSQETLISYGLIKEPEFFNLCNEYYKRVKQRISHDVSRKFIDAIKLLNYEEIGKFKLIEEKWENVDIFIELDDKAEKIWKEYEEIQQTKDFKKRKQRFLQIRNPFYFYVISIPLKKAQENLPPERAGIRYVSKSQLNEYYDLETGFKINPDSLIW